MSIETERDAIRLAAKLLHKAASHIKVLKAIDWCPDIAERFFASGAHELPRPAYTPCDPGPSQAALAELRSVKIGHPVIAAWVERQAEAIGNAAMMMAGVGTPDFYLYGGRLYGTPTTPLRFFPETPLDLAKRVREVTAQLGLLHVKLAPSRYYTAGEVADELRVGITRHFGNEAPRIEIVDTLSANALASSKVVRLKRDARFTDYDARQLLQHEAFVHVATSLNGRLQTDLPILGCAHPYDARTQEGLAVFAEMVSGAMEMDRLQRLADRVFAIHMAVEGANFIEVYRHFLEESDQPAQSFERARRVFRGGVITGGAPFAKDLVYLFGLLQVSNTFRALFASGRPDVLPLLFCGKLDISDIPALAELAALGLVRAPRFMPPWATDPRTLFALLTYSMFMGRMNVEALLGGVRTLLAETPPVSLSKVG